MKCKYLQYETILKIGEIGAKIKRKKPFAVKRGRFGKTWNYLHRFIFYNASNGVQ